MNSTSEILEENTRKFDYKLILWLFSFVRNEKALVICSFCLVFAVSFLAMVPPIVTKTAIDNYIIPKQINGLYVLCLAFFAIRILIFIVTCVHIFVMSFVGQKIMFRLRNHILAHSVKLAKQFFDKTPTGKLITRVTSDVDALNEVLTSGFIVFLADILMLLGIVGMLLFINWRLALIIYILFPVLYMGFRYFRKKITPIYRREREIISRMNAMLQESIVGMHIIQLFNRQKFNFQTFSKLNEEYYSVQIGALKYYTTFFPFISFLSIISKSLIIWYGGMLYLKLDMSIGEIVAFVSYCEMIFGPLREMSEKYNLLQSAMAASEKIAEITNEPISAEYRTPGNYKATIHGKIEFRNVWFAYNEENYVLRDVSFVIQPGETVAIVGQTGSGKTTVINLIGRFYEISQGDIFIDDVNLHAWDIEWLRKNLGIVLQDVFLFSGTLAENITLFEDNLVPSIEEIIQQVNAERFLNSLPDGLQTLILEGGKSLSVGQRQLVSFARTLCREPKVLILDEATANIDTETEKDIQAAIARMTAGRTAIIIAHRLSTIRHAHKIFVFHKGELRENGSHSELMLLEGIYRDLYTLQYKEQEN